MRWWPFALLVACEAMPPTGAPLQPVPAVSTPATRPGPTAVVPVPDGSFSFDDDEGEEPEPDDFAPDDPATLLALAQGLPVPPPVDPASTPEPLLFDPFAAPTEPPGPVALAVWDPATATAPNWGVRLVSTLVDTQPPRAVLGLPDGTEIVVKPGTMLAANRLVVMAVGRDVVQVSRVIPDGYQARIETRTLRSFYPARPPTP